MASRTPITLGTPLPTRRFRYLPLVPEVPGESTPVQSTSTLPQANQYTPPLSRVVHYPNTMATPEALALIEASQTSSKFFDLPDNNLGLEEPQSPTPAISTQDKGKQPRRPELASPLAAPPMVPHSC